MNPTAEQIEQVAQICWEAQRALLQSRGLAALHEAVPAAWCVAMACDKQAARNRVLEWWDKLDRGAVIAAERFENQLTFDLVRSAHQFALGKTAGKML